MTCEEAWKRIKILFWELLVIVSMFLGYKLFSYLVQGCPDYRDFFNGLIQGYIFLMFAVFAVPELINNFVAIYEAMKDKGML